MRGQVPWNDRYLGAFSGDLLIEVLVIVYYYIVIQVKKLNSEEDVSSMLGKEGNKMGINFLKG
ncbi:MAG: hypothetical protein IT393_06645 [Nitrospirae bacterium]|nr:hypothetical protein [Nitrospirota bacterium]